MDERALRDLFAQCDVGWVFEGEGDESASERARQIVGQMSALTQKYEEKVGSDLPETVERRILSDVVRFKPLVQSFASPDMTSEMRTMIFCLLNGGQVRAIKFEYKLKQRAHLEVEIVTGAGKAIHFESDELWDAEVLRHFGLAKLSGSPFIDGYYAFRKSAS